MNLKYQYYKHLFCGNDNWMNSTPGGTRIKNSRKSMSNLYTNKLLIPTNIQRTIQHVNSQSQQLINSQIEENAFFIPKKSLRRPKFSESKLAVTSTTGKSLQSQLMYKLLQENIQLQIQNSRKQVLIRELVSPSKDGYQQKRQTLNTEPNQETGKKSPPVPEPMKQSLVFDDQYKFTFYSPKCQDVKQRLPKEFQIVPCSKKRYFI